MTFTNYDRAAITRLCSNFRCAAFRSAVSQTQSSNAIGYAKFLSLSYDTVIRVYDEAGNVIETYEHAGDFKEW